MAYARHLQAATIDFLVGDTAPLEREDALLAMAGAMAGDGHVAETANVLTYVLGAVDDPNKVREALIQTSVLIGIPRTLSAMEAFTQALEKAGIDGGKLSTAVADADTSNDDLIARGEKAYAAIYGDNAKKLSEKLEGFSPDLHRWIKLHAYGRVLSKDGLSVLQREFITIAALIPMDVRPQLRSHVQGAVNLGASGDQVWMLFDTVKKLFEAPKLFDRTRETIEKVLGKKASGLTFEEEQQYKWG